MCYYDQTRYTCGDFKWGPFRKHCQKEYRMGETCGGRLVYNTLPDSSLCRYCQDIDRKKRRYEKARSDYNRWVGDKDRQASAAKAYEDTRALYAEIEKLQAARADKYYDLGSRRAQQVR